MTEKLKEHKTRLQTLFKAITDTVIVIDHRLQYPHVQPEAYRQQGAMLQEGLRPGRAVPGLPRG